MTKQKKVLIVLALATSLLIYVIASFGRPSEVQGTDGQAYYLVQKVVDGDTFDVVIQGKKQRIRLIGVNTPETVDPRRKVECFGKEASSKAKELIYNKYVRLDLDE